MWNKVLATAGMGVLALLLGTSLTSCSGKAVRQVYKPGATNVFETECTTEQLCMKAAREHCEGDFEVLKKGHKATEKDDDENLETLEFRCI